MITLCDLDHCGVLEWGVVCWFGLAWFLKSFLPPITFLSFYFELYHRFKGSIERSLSAFWPFCKW